MAVRRPIMPEQIAKDIRHLGVEPGGVVMVHASLRAIGPVVGGVDGVLDGLEAAIGPQGTLLMVLGADDPWAWVNVLPEPERAALLGEAKPFDARQTPADPGVGFLAEAFRQRPGTLCSDHPEGRFGARGRLAQQLVENVPWDDYFGPGSPLDRLCKLGGGVLRMGADMDTTTLLHWAEYLTVAPSKRRVRRHRCVVGSDGPEIRVIDSLDDSGEGIVDWPGDDYFQVILEDYLAAGWGVCGLVGAAQSHFIDAQDLVDFAVRWMDEKFT